AQDDTLDAATFWARLRQTDKALQQIVAHADRGPALAQLKQMWQGVQRVRVQNTVIEIDLQWLMQPLATGDLDALTLLRQRVGALLNYHDHEGPGIAGVASLTTLENILKDPRFQYPEPTPTMTPTPDSGSSEGGLSAWNFSPELSQLLLAAAGVVGVVGVLLYFARNLRVRPAQLAMPGAPEEPTTSANALGLAADHAASRDYRRAVRYLYLSSLLMLDERELIDYNATLTNREHLAQIRDKPQLLEVLRQIVDVFEAVWYGYAPIDAALYDQYYQRIQHLYKFVK
ncbi:MAG TPA: DUF4129 domain-containing protein, partial [Aggregatilineales bacterium]|nr:DUF4129 domain-containing protein [Aggregatilineales bacterium]